MRTIKFSMRVVTGALLCACSVSCVQWEVGRRLNAVGKYLDEYGTVSVSSPLLADVSSDLFEEAADSFKFNLKAGPDEYFEFARNEIHGQMATSSETGLDSRTGIQVRANLEDLLTNRIRLDRFREDEGRFRRRQSASDAAGVLNLILPLIDPKFGVAQVVNEAASGDDQAPQDGAEQGTVGDVAEPPKLTPKEEEIARLKGLIEAFGANAATFGPEQRPDIPEFTHNLPTIDPDLRPGNELTKELLADAKFSKFLALAKTRPIRIEKNPVRPAIAEAAGNQKVEAIMTFLGHPKAAVGDWNDKAVLMGVSMVSVAPGTRTERGYVADVAVTCRYAYRPVRRSLVLELLKSEDKYLQKLLEAFKHETDEILITETMGKYPEIQENLISNYVTNQSDTAPEGIGLDWLRKIDHCRATGPLGSLEALFKKPVTAEDLDAGATNRTFLELVYDPSETSEQMVLRESPDTLVTSAPLVSAVSPMTSAQNLDLSSSIRQQQAFALRLAIVVSGFGADAQVDSLMQYVNRLEQDVVTRTPLNTVAGYSNSGGTFGYQIGPDFRGIADFEPTRRKGMLDGLINGTFQPGPDMVLQRQSFPVALFIGLDRDDLRPRIMHIYNPIRKEKKHRHASSGEHIHDDDCQWLLVEPRLEFAQTVRWIPTRHSKGLPLMDKLLDHRPRVHESDRVTWAYELDEAADLAKKHNRGENKFRPFREYVRQRVDTLRSQALGASSTQAIPLGVMLGEFKKRDPKNTPRITKVVPQAPCFERDDATTPKNDVKSITFALVGSNLKRVDEQSSKGGLRVRTRGSANIQVVKSKRVGNTIIVEIKATPAPTAPVTVWFELPIKNKMPTEPDNILSPPVQICPPPGSPAKKKDEEKDEKKGDGKSKELVLIETVSPATANQSAQGTTGGSTVSGKKETVTRKITIPFNTPMRLAELFLRSLQQPTGSDNQVKIDLNIDASTQIKGASALQKEEPAGSS